MGRFLVYVTVEPVAFAFMLAILCEYTAIQELVFTRLCMKDTDTEDPTNCTKTDERSNISSALRTTVSAEEAVVMRYYMGIMTFFALIPTAYAGAWSDSVSPKLPMLMPSVFGLMAEAVLIICATFIEYDLINLIYLAAFLNGVCGGSSSVLASCFGYIARTTSQANRTKRITVLEAMFFMGGFCGFNLAGLLLKYAVGSHYQYIFIVVSVIHLFIITYTILFVDDSEWRKRRAILKTEDTDSGDESFQSRRTCLFSFNHIVDMFAAIFRKTNPPQLRSKLVLLVICSAMSFLGLAVQTNLLFVYVKKPPLNWSSSTYSLFGGINFLVSGMSLVAGLPLAYYRWPHISDTLVGMLGFASKMLGLTVLGVAQTTSIMFLCPLLLLFSEYTMPSIRSMVSKLVEEKEKGKAFAFLATVQNLCSFAGGLLFYSLFVATIDWFPGFSFEFVALLQIIALVILMYIHVRLPLTRTDQHEVIEQHPEREESHEN